MSQNVVIQVGQCGNQIGSCFWNLALNELQDFIENTRDVKVLKGAKPVYNVNGNSFNHAVNCFFKNETATRSSTRNYNIKARAVLIDMEEGVLNSVENGNICHLFSKGQVVKSCSGSGNNWAVGHYEYGNSFKDLIIDAIQKEVEHCDSLQGFFLLHSMGGGTGSGLGSRILRFLDDEFPHVPRLVLAVYPSELDDVVTSPYNTLLATNVVTQHADAVMPVENQALIDICSSLPRRRLDKTRAEVTNGQPLHGRGRTFDTLNNIIANVMLHVTSGSRFPGDMNVDLNEIPTNLVPYPRLCYLTPCLAPLQSLTDLELPTRSVDNMFTDVISKKLQLLKCDPFQGVYLTCGLLCRGQVAMSDVQKNTYRLKKLVNFVGWNNDHWKVGLCSVPSRLHPYSLLSLANNTCVTTLFSRIIHRFHKLYRRKAHIHHYLEVSGMEVVEIEESVDSLVTLIADYEEVKTPFKSTPRLKLK